MWVWVCRWKQAASATSLLARWADWAGTHTSAVQPRLWHSLCPGRNEHLCVSFLGWPCLVILVEVGAGLKVAEPVTVVKAKRPKSRFGLSVVSLKAQGETCLPAPAPSGSQCSVVLTGLGLSPSIFYFHVAISPSCLCPNCLPIRTPILLALGPTLLGPTLLQYIWLHANLVISVKT